MQPKQQHWRRLKKSLPVLIAPTLFFSISKQKKKDFFFFPGPYKNLCFFFLFCLDNCKSCWIAKGAQCVSSNKSRLLFFSIRVLRTRAIKVWWCRKKNKWTRQTCAHFSCVSSSTDSTEKKLFDFSSIFGGIWTFSKANRRTISHGRLGDFGGRKSCQSARSVSPLVPF